MSIKKLRCKQEMIAHNAIALPTYSVYNLRMMGIGSTKKLWFLKPKSKYSGDENQMIAGMCISCEKVPFQSARFMAPLMAISEAAGKRKHVVIRRK